MLEPSVRPWNSGHLSTERCWILGDILECGDHLFGPKFMSQLIAHAKVQSTLNDIRPVEIVPAPSIRGLGERPSTSSSHSQQQGQPTYSNNFNGRYDRFYLVLSLAFGGRVARFRFFIGVCLGTHSTFHTTKRSNGLSPKNVVRTRSAFSVTKRDNS